MTIILNWINRFFLSVCVNDCLEIASGGILTSQSSACVNGYCLKLVSSEMLGFGLGVGREFFGRISVAVFTFNFQTNRRV